MDTSSVRTLTVTGFLSLGAAAAIPTYHKYKLGGMALTLAAKTAAVALGVIGGVLLLLALYQRLKQTSSAATNSSNTALVPPGNKQLNTEKKSSSNTAASSGGENKSAESKGPTPAMKARMAALQKAREEGDPLAEKPKSSAAVPPQPGETPSPLPPLDPATLSVVPTPPPLLPPSSSELSSPQPPAPPQEDPPILLSDSENGSPPPAPLPPSDVPATGIVPIAPSAPAAPPEPGNAPSLESASANAGTSLFAELQNKKLKKKKEPAIQPPAAVDNKKPNNMFAEMKAKKLQSNTARSPQPKPAPTETPEQKALRERRERLEKQQAEAAGVKK